VSHEQRIENLPKFDKSSNYSISEISISSASLPSLPSVLLSEAKPSFTPLSPSSPCFFYLEYNYYSPFFELVLRLFLEFEYPLYYYKNIMDKKDSKSNNKNGSSGKIGPWVLGSFLGQGYAAQVREVVHEKTGQKAAIKILTKDDTNEKADLLKKMREKEITIMKLVDHPNIVRLYDVYETTNHIYLVMELLQGSLFSYVVKSVRISPNKALVLFQQIIEALDYMHKHLICHRDLKPENFLLNSQTTLKVCDFGFASLMKGDSEMLTTRCGTLHYASPDILTEGDGYDGRLHDVWSAGVNLYVMVTGELPFNDKNPKILLRKIMTGTFEFPPQVPLPYDLKDLIFKMLTVDAKQRISIPEIKRHPWFCSKPYNVPVDVAGHINIEEPIEDIDEQILHAIVLLGVGWDTVDQLRSQLKQKSANSEKVVYLLLLRKKLSPSLESFSYSYAEKATRGELTPPTSAAAAATPSTATTTTAPAATPAPAAGSNIQKSNSSSSLSTPPPLNLNSSTASTGSGPSPSNSPRNGASTSRDLPPKKGASNVPTPGGSITKKQKKAYRLSTLHDDKREEAEESPPTSRLGKKRDKNTPGTPEPEQNNAVSSIDKILNWFNKDKQSKAEKSSNRKSGLFKKRAPTPAKEGDDEVQMGTNPNLQSQNEAFFSMNEEEEGDFFDLIMRANQTPSRDLRRADKAQESTSPAPTSTPAPTQTPAPTPTATATKTTKSEVDPAPTAPSTTVPPSPPPNTSTPSPLKKEDVSQNESPQKKVHEADTNGSAHQKPTEEKAIEEKTDTKSPSSQNTIAGAQEGNTPLTVYISFVPTEFRQDYESDHQKKNTFSANRCTLQARDASGNITKVLTRKQFDDAVAAHSHIEISP
jgi:serine/threonine protein kinase